MTVLRNGNQNWQEEEEQRKIFQFCVNPNSSNKFLYLRAIQGHSGDNAVDPPLQDNVLLPKGFTEFICDVGSANELHSKIRNGFIPGGTSLKRGRQAVLITTVNLMEDLHGIGETPCDLTKPRIAPYKNTWKRLDNTVFWCHVKLEVLQFYQTRSQAVVLHNTLLAACIEQAVCMKTQEGLRQKMRSTPRMPRVGLKSNSQYGPQDPQSQEARSSWEPTSDSKSYGETCSNTVDHRISGVPLSAEYNTREQVQKVDREVREPLT